jgi:hypothetical protein
VTRIAIVGGHSGTRGKAPFGDPGWTIWSCSYRNMGRLPRVDAWFELHRLEPGILPEDYIDWLAALEAQVYLQAADARFPRAAVYPSDAMVERFGRLFFTSTVAWMLALAISRTPKAIGLWGVHQATGEEYRHQRPACHHFIEVARMLGIDVVVPPASGLTKGPSLYAYETIGGEQEGEAYRSPFAARPH